MISLKRIEWVSIHAIVYSFITKNPEEAHKFQSFMEQVEKAIPHLKRFREEDELMRTEISGKPS